MSAAFQDAKNFLWDPTGGLRFLEVEGGGSVRGIDDDGVIWFSSCRVDGVGTCRLFTWIDGVVSEVPTPPGAQSTSISKVRSNGVVLMSTAHDVGRRTWWSYDRGTYTEFPEPTGVTIWAATEHGAMGGGRLLDPFGRTGRAYLRLPDGRTSEPWPTPCQTFSTPRARASPYSERPDTSPGSA
jgi:hypothetical protein